MSRYKIYQPKADAVAETHGQCWAGESVEENIALCEVQTIQPLLLRYLPVGGRILESGCGLGRWVFYLRRRGYEVLGIDLATDAVGMAKAFDPEVPISIDDVVHSNFESDSFDAVISLGVVEHFEEGPREALLEFRRLLKTGGMLFISVPVQNFLRITLTNPLKDLYRAWRRRKGIQFAFEEYRYTRREFDQILRDIGFRIVEVVPDDFMAPKNLGVYADIRILRGSGAKWELNGPGKLLVAVMRRISPWGACAGAFWVCTKVPPVTRQSLIRSE